MTNPPNPTTFLSEIVQYWTAIYPQLADHQKAQSTKNKAWELINDPDLEANGEIKRLNGKIQEKSVKARWKAGKALKKTGKIISGKR